MNSISHYRVILEDWKSRKKLLLEQKEQKEVRQKELQIQISNLTYARFILNTVSKETQEDLSNYIETLVTMILTSVFTDRQFNFLVQNEIKRNKAEISFKIYEGEQTDKEIMINNSFVPSQEMGGGLIDIISLALRVVMWSLEVPRSRNTIILDEPVKFLDTSLMDKVGRILKEISDKLDLQFIIITHIEELITVGDRSFKVSFDGVKSSVTRIMEEYNNIPTKSLLKRRSLNLI